MQINLQIFENTVATSRAVAALIKEKEITTPSYKFLNLAVSGGTTPRMLFEMLGNEYETSINWKKVRFFGWTNAVWNPPMQRAILE